MKVLYVDETGDHSLSKIDKSYPIFVLSGVISDQAYHDSELTIRLNLLKLKHFGTKDIVLHSKEMTHPQSANNKLYMNFMNTEFRKKFGTYILHKPNWLKTADQ